MKGLFIPEITVEMFRNGCLEAVEQLMAEGEIYDIEYDQKRKESGWIPFRQAYNFNTKRYEFSCDLPDDGERILVCIDEDDGKRYVREDTWYENSYCYLDSGYDPIADAVAWMSLPKVYEGEKNECRTF